MYPGPPAPAGPGTLIQPAPPVGFVRLFVTQPLEAICISRASSTCDDLDHDLRHVSSGQPLTNSVPEPRRRGRATTSAPICGQHIKAAGHTTKRGSSSKATRPLFSRYPGSRSCPPLSLGAQASPCGERLSQACASPFSCGTRFPITFLSCYLIETSSWQGKLGESPNRDCCRRSGRLPSGASHPCFKFLVYLCRPTLKAHAWEDLPGIYGGRDSREGGTWLAVAKQGMASLLTTFRQSSPAPPAQPISRGFLVSRYLAGDERDPKAYMDSVDTKASAALLE